MTLRLLGPMSIERLDGDTAPLRRQRVREMLALLAFDGPVSRDRLVDTLWPEHPVDKVRSNLRTTLSHLGRLRTIDDERLFVETNHGLDLQPDVKVDATEFDRLTRAAAEAQRAGADSAAFDHFARALEMVTGTPLDDVRGELYFDRLADIWMIAVVTAASQAAELGNRLGHHDSAIAFANLAIRIDQYHEPGYRLLIEAHLARGDRVAATATATALQAMLDDFGVEPESATNEVLARIQRQ